MQGSFDIVGLTDLIEVLTNAGVTGALRIRPGDEARLWFESGRITHAEYRHHRGTEVVSEVLRWTGDRFKFEAGARTPERSITQPTAALILEAAELIDTVRATGGNGAQVFYDLPLPPGATLTALEQSIHEHAAGTTLRDLAALTRASLGDVARTVKRLLDRGLLRHEDVPYTPETLARTTPRPRLNISYQGSLSDVLTGDTARPRSETPLTVLEQRVLAAVDGRASLEDIRTTLTLTREQVWRAYRRLVNLGRITA